MKKLHMIGNTHFDPVWLWQWDEALSSITATFRSALCRMEEYEDFTYSFSAPSVFEWIKNTDTELFEKICQRICEGRWELCEGWWLQPDCNGALGESYVRQGLYAQKYLQENFGKKSRTVFNIDSFGHPGSLVQILAGCGIENYVFWRPNEAQKHISAPLFFWEGENGASVKAYRIGGAGGEIFTEDLYAETLKPLFDEATGNDDLMVVYGVTDHGGTPTIKMIEEIRRTSEEKAGEAELLFSTVENFFDNADMKKAPHIKDEFQVTFIGPYSNFAEVKQNNRKCEYVLLNAEKAALIAEKLLGREYPQETLTKAWKDTLFNQFHDILGGCCIEDAYFDARNLHGRVLETGKEIIHFSLQAVTNKIKMPGKNPDNEWNLVIWNLNGCEVESDFEAEVQWAWEFDWYRGDIVLTDGDANEIPCQIIEEKPVLPGFRSRFVFRAKIPPMGYKVFSVHRRSAKALPKKSGVLEMECGEDGKIQIIKDGKVLISELLRPYAVGDNCDTWGFNKTVFENEKQYLRAKSVEITEDGFVRKTLRIMWECNRSTVEQFVSLYSDHVDVKYRVLWNEERLSLKFECSTGRAMKCEAGAPYGAVLREKSEFEKPMSEWVRLFDAEDDISILTGSAFAYGFDGSMLGITVLRNALFGDLRREPLDESRHNRYMGQGAFSGSFRIVFGKNSAREAALFNNPPIILCEANHDGIYPFENSFFEIDEKDVLLGAVKKAESGDECVVRLYNSSSERIKTKFKLFGEETETEINAKEIKTFMESSVVNMLEEK